MEDDEIINALNISFDEDLSDCGDDSDADPILSFVCFLLLFIYDLEI